MVLNMANGSVISSAFAAGCWIARLGKDGLSDDAAAEIFFGSKTMFGNQAE